MSQQTGISDAGHKWAYRDNIWTHLRSLMLFQRQHMAQPRQRLTHGAILSCPNEGAKRVPLDVPIVIEPRQFRAVLGLLASRSGEGWKGG